MGLIIKPHQVLVLATTETAQGANRMVYVPGHPSTAIVVWGLLDTEKQDAVFDRVGRVLREPHVFLCDLQDVGNFADNYMVKDVKWGRIFAVRGNPAIADAGGVLESADHADVLLERLEDTKWPLP